MKYIITYTRNEKTYKVTRHADTAAQAIYKLCDQYGYEYHLHLMDADTYGQEWADVDVYKPEYCSTPSWIFRAFAEIAKD